MWSPNLARSIRLPADPYIIYVPDTSRYVQFSNYRDPIPASGIRDVITDAFKQIRDHASTADAPIRSDIDIRGGRRESRTVAYAH